MFKIQTLNPIASIGLKHFPKELYEVTSEAPNPDAILVRSYKMHDMTIPSSVKLIGRAGAGINNIPVSVLTKRGIPVFNTPGANANAVRELVLAGMLLASRNICQAWHYVNQLKLDESNLSQTIEQNKKQFVGFELMGKTLGVIGLGSVGVKVANAAQFLGMQVIGYDPAITVGHAWELSANVKQAQNLDDLIAASDFISLHVPLTETTQGMINHARIALMKEKAVLLNFARDGIIVTDVLHDALNANKILAYVTDFPSLQLKDHPKVITLPHLGASTKEAEENCAIMLAKQVRAYLENGSIKYSANFPSMELGACKGKVRLAIANENIPNMVAQISSVLAQAKLNIISLYNQSKENIAYTVIDLDELVSEPVINEIKRIAGVLQLRMIA